MPKKVPLSSNATSAMTATTGRLKKVSPGDVTPQTSKVGLASQLRDDDPFDVTMLVDLTLRLQRASTLETAVTIVLQRLIESLGWSVGLAYLRPETNTDAVQFQCWSVSPALRSETGTTNHLRRLRSAVTQLRYSLDSPWVGSVLRTGQPRFSAEISTLGLDTGDQFVALGLTAAAAFPVRTKQSVIAVVEFFSPTPMTLSPTLVDRIHCVTTQLAHALERQQWEQRLAEALRQQQRYFGIELHDSIAQQLTGLTLLSQALLEKLQSTQHVDTHAMDVLVKHLQRTHDEVRRLSQGLIPVNLKEPELSQAFRELARSVTELHQIPCEFRARIRVTVAPVEKRIHLYRIVQEAIQNAIKHAQPTRIDVTITKTAGKPVLTVRDNGRGFDASDPSLRHSGLGIMSYRADLIGGRLTIESTPDGGTVVVCQFDS